MRGSCLNHIIQDFVNSEKVLGLYQRSVGKHLKVSVGGVLGVDVLFGITLGSV